MSSRTIPMPDPSPPLVLARVLRALEALGHVTQVFFGEAASVAGATAAGLQIEREEGIDIPLSAG